MSFAPGRGAQVRAGFTLLEILAVLLVIGILTAIVIGVGRRAAESSRVARAKVELAALADALEAYKRVFGDYPQTDDPAQMLQSLLGRRDPAGAPIGARAVIELGPFTVEGGRDPRADPSARLLDPWEQPYRYVHRVPAGGWRSSGFILYSAGPDGQATEALLPGGFPDLAAAGNADNIHANR